MVTISYPSAELTNNDTIEKNILGSTFEDIAGLSQSYEISKDTVIRILEHDLPNEIYGTIELLIKNDLMNLYIKEMMDDIEKDSL